MQRFEDLQRIEHGAHADIVRNAAVDEMEIGSTDAVAEGLLSLERAYRPRSGTRRVVGIEERLQECGSGALQVPP
jgi:hypothetical protein